MWFLSALKNLYTHTHNNVLVNFYTFQTRRHRTSNSLFAELRPPFGYPDIRRVRVSMCYNRPMLGNLLHGANGFLSEFENQILLLYLRLLYSL